ncbi:hypothetical protein Pmani_028005 [Petrolisthes manimaculis]|uniref:SHSP domain-containing protein n=1 Tax=Petrolisthes manimaculis TaxID=1843537 RepID=A0AAE1TW45_9EUCA|nr:hypothetical protein Pmani_028005 [Petrolisthes manimaculis]
MSVLSSFNSFVWRVKMMMRLTRMFPRMRRVPRFTQAKANGQVPQVALTAPTSTRSFYRGPLGRDPFRQMEEFMRDMERKFKRDIESTMGSFIRDFPRGGAQELVPKASETAFGYVENVSTENSFKLAFNFANAKQEDINVTLKGRNLTVSSKAEVETESSKSSYSMSQEYQLPEDVEVEALESTLSPEGILTVEAPRTSGKEAQAPQAIHINRE